MRTLVLSSLLVLAFASSSVGQTTGDAELAKAAAATICGYSHFSIFDDINVEVNDRSVTLTGWVTMPFKRNDIGSRVSKLDGVRSVVNDIQVLPISNRDAELRLRVAHAIYSNPSFWQYASMANPPIHIVVERGRVTLTGRVNNDVERMLAYTLAQVDGALGVKNELKVDKN